MHEERDDNETTESFKICLTARESAVAEEVARRAVKYMQQEFYASVGKTVITRWLIIIGLLVVAFATGKGWLPPKV